MKTTGLIILLFAAICISAQTKPAHPRQAATPDTTTTVTETNQTDFCCRHPLRVFGNNTTVNLTPLFKWWTHQPAEKTGTSTASETKDSSRPLVKWQRITVTKGGSDEYAWIVDAAIYTSPTDHSNARIVLKNPPTTEEQAYYTLKAQLAQLEQQITNAQSAYQADLAAAKKAETRAQTDKSHVKNRRAGANSVANVAAQAAKQDNAAATTALNLQKQLEQQLTVTEKQLAAIPAENGRYHIDWFAMEVGHDKKGLPIYDIGVVDPRSP